MKVIKVEHDRCAETDKVAYYTAPDSMTVQEIKGVLRIAQDAYIMAYNLFEEIQPDVPEALPTDVMKYPDTTITIGDAQDAISRNKAAIERAWKAKKRMETSFEDELRKHGIVSLWEADFDELDFTVSWGHSHGKDYKYGQDS